MTKKGSLYFEYDINSRWDDPSKYGEASSAYGEGRYPPDWDQRREAVLAAQNYWCARCKRYKSNVAGFAVHHINFLSDGGSNHLDNLVGLCGDCHALMHPENDDIDGVAGNAPMLPHPDADPRVAVARRPVADIERRNRGGAIYALEATAGGLGENRVSHNPMCYFLSEEHTRALAEDFEEIVETFDLTSVPRERILHISVSSTGEYAVPRGTTVTVSTVDGRETKTADQYGYVGIRVDESVTELDVRIDADNHDSVDRTLRFGDDWRREMHVELDERIPAGDLSPEQTASPEPASAGRRSNGHRADTATATDTTASDRSTNRDDRQAANEANGFYRRLLIWMVISALFCVTVTFVFDQPLDVLIASGILGVVFGSLVSLVFQWFN